jgi:NADH dehydrogenase
MAEIPENRNRLVTIFGGSGFVGRHVVRALARQGWRIRVAVRRPDLAIHLQPIGRVGQIHPVQANLRYPESVAAAVRDSDAVINLVGILSERGRQRFDAIHTFGARAVAKATLEAGINTLVHMSAIGANPDSASLYARSKGLGEIAVRELVPQAVVTRPSVIFGPDDSLFNRFGTLVRALPVLPLIGGGETKFQPVFVGDVAAAIAVILEGKAQPGGIYEFGGPNIKTLRQLMQFVCSVTGRKRVLMPLPFGVASWISRVTEVVDILTLGLLPSAFITTPDQVRLLKEDNLVSPQAERAGLILQALGITPTAIEPVVPTYLIRFRKYGQFDPTDRLITGG